METLPMIAFGAASPFNCLSVREGVVLFVSFQKQQPHQQVPPKCYTICLFTNRRSERGCPKNS